MEKSQSYGVFLIFCRRFYARGGSFGTGMCEHGVLAFLANIGIIAPKFSGKITGFGPTLPSVPP